MLTQKNAKNVNKNPIERLMQWLDALQQRHKFLSFPYAVVKKYGDDEAGYQGALLTYYGFLSLFPLLIVATSVIGIVSRGNEALRNRLSESITSYFPAIGDSLQASIHTSSKTGVALAVGLIIAFFGARGVADALQHALNHIWEVPKQKRPNFPKGPLKSLLLIIGGGLGFAVTAIVSGYATALGHSLIIVIGAFLVSVLLLIGVFTFIFHFGSSAKKTFNDVLPGAVVAAIGMALLQVVGVALVKHQLKNLTGLYGQFALVLAILFWLYLLAQVFLYAAEVNTVKSLKLWPRSLTGKPLLDADRKAYSLYAERETVHDFPAEEVDVKFHGKTSSQ